MYDLIPAPFYLSLHVNLHDSGNRIEIEGQKIFPSKNVSVLKIKHEYNDTQNNTNNNNNNNNNTKYHLLFESEVITGKSQTGALMY